MQGRHRGQSPGAGPAAEGKGEGKGSPGEAERAEEAAGRRPRSARIPPEIRERLARFAGAGLPVFIRGEEGAGKGEVAKALHLSGPFGNRPFLRFSSRGLTPRKFAETLSVWLSGPDPGPRFSFTLYLEDLETLEEEMQALLLDLLEDGRIRWPGLEGRFFDFQLLSSSSDLREAVAGRRFREGLFRTLQTLSLRLRPLRERKEEIPGLAEEILREKGRGEKGPGRISPEALALLQDYDWPGNLAELESVLLRSAALKEGDILAAGDLSFLPPGGALSPGPVAEEKGESWFDVTIPTLAHEIKNPLVAISTFSHLLPDKYEDPEFRQEFSRLVHQDVRKINDLLENLLEFAQFSVPRAGLQDLNAALAELLPPPGQGPGQPGRPAVADLERELPPVRFDKTHLTFVLRNLLDHAFSRLGPEAALHLSTRSSREEKPPGPGGGVDLVLWYNHPDGGAGGSARLVDFGSEPNFQNLNLSLLLARKVMARNRGKILVFQGEEGGMTLRLQFPTAG